MAIPRSLGAHWLLHRVDALWEFHKVHHSSRTLDWLATFRSHLVEQVVRRLVAPLLLLVAGFPLDVIVAAAAIFTVWATFNHSNLRARLGPLEHPVTHRSQPWRTPLIPADPAKEVRVLHSAARSCGRSWPTGAAIGASHIIREAPRIPVAVDDARPGSGDACSQSSGAPRVPMHVPDCTRPARALAASSETGSTASLPGPREWLARRCAWPRGGSAVGWCALRECIHTSLQFAVVISLAPPQDNQALARPRAFRVTLRGGNGRRLTCRSTCGCPPARPRAIGRRGRRARRRGPVARSIPSRLARSQHRPAPGHGPDPRHRSRRR